MQRTRNKYPWWMWLLTSLTGLLAAFLSAYLKLFVFEWYWGIYLWIGFYVIYLSPTALILGAVSGRAAFRFFPYKYAALIGSVLFGLIFGMIFSGGAM